MKLKKFFSKVSNFASDHKKLTIVLALGLSIAIFLIIALSKIGAWSIWFDESFSVFMVKHSFSEIWNYTALDVNAPFYYFLLKIWSGLFGFSDVALRSMSVLFAAGSIVAIFFLMRKLFGQKVGYLSLVFATFSPMLLRYSTEMRCYTLLIFLLLLSTLALIKANKDNGKIWWFVYGTLIAMAMWTHYYSALVIISQLVWRAVVIRNKTSKPKEFVKKYFTKGFILSVVTATVIFLPWIGSMFYQMIILKNSGFWIPTLSLDTIINFLGEAISYSTHDRISNYVTIAFLAMIVLAVIVLPKIWRSIDNKGRSSLNLLLLLTFLPPTLLMILSMPPMRPMFINRYVIFSMVMLVLIFAVAFGIKLKNKSDRISQYLLFGFSILLMINGTLNVLHYGNYNFDTNTISVAKSAMQSISEYSSEKIPVITDNPWTFYDADVYASDKNPVYFPGDSTDYRYGSLEMLRDDKTHKIMDVAKFAKTGDKIWYLCTTKDAAKQPPVGGWKLIEWFSVADPIEGKTFTNAGLYVVE